MKKYKAIILVLASEDTSKILKPLRPFYPSLKRAFESYMFHHPDIKVLYVYGAGTRFERKEYDLVYDQVLENYYPGMIKKTLYAIEHIHKNYDYDFLIRTNLSQFWIFDRLVKRLDQLPKEKCVTGTRIDFKDRLTREVIDQYTAGFDLHISRDLVSCLVDNQKRIIDTAPAIVEDQIICRAIKKYTGISHDNHGLVDRNGTYHARLFFGNNQQVPSHVDHIRMKLPDRAQEKLLVQHLVKEFYDIDFNPSD